MSKERLSSTLGSHVETDGREYAHPLKNGPGVPLCSEKPSSGHDRSGERRCERVKNKNKKFYIEHPVYLY
tara:strand:- start:350 stop:559 length:210 start_codon:yes stop_codon:yes gene_type:complete